MPSQDTFERPVAACSPPGGLRDSVRTRAETSRPKSLDIEGKPGKEWLS